MQQGVGAIKQVLVMVAFSPTEAREIKVSSPTKARELMQGALRGALLLVVSSKELTPEGLELILRAQEGVVLMVLTP